VSLEDAIGSKSGEELNQAKRRLRELQSELEYTKRKNSKTNLITNGLDNAEALLSTTLKCPEGAMKGIWVEAVWYGSLPDFPAKQNYVTLGCKDKNGLEKGRFISWYPNGQVVSKGLAEGEQTFYYPNGNKAAEAGSIGDQFVESKRLWALDGKEIER
jgi:antitoxin component YwqK of YwqJK toxin-antitoxin module